MCTLVECSSDSPEACPNHPVNPTQIYNPYAEISDLQDLIEQAEAANDSFRSSILYKRIAYLDRYSIPKYWREQRALFASLPHAKRTPS